MKPTKGMIKLVFLNADSIVNKIDLLQAHACELEPDILVVTESWTHTVVLGDEKYRKNATFEIFWLITCFYP